MPKPLNSFGLHTMDQFSKQLLDLGPCELFQRNLHRSLSIFLIIADGRMKLDAQKDIRGALRSVMRPAIERNFSFQPVSFFVIFSKRGVQSSFLSFQNVKVGLGM